MLWLVFIISGLAVLLIVFLDFKNKRTTTFRGLIVFDKERNPIGFWATQIFYLVAGIFMLYCGYTEFFGLIEFE